MKTRRRPLRVVGLLAALAVVAAGYVALAPTSIGGSTIYSFTYGTSMQPKLHCASSAASMARAPAMSPRSTLSSP